MPTQDEDYIPFGEEWEKAMIKICETILKYVKSDFSKPKFSWLHCCEKCHKEYWLDNRYPLIDYIVDTNTPLLHLETNPIQPEEG